MPTHRSLRMAEAIREVVATTILFDVADPRVALGHGAPCRGLERLAQRHGVCVDHGDRGRAEAGFPRARPRDGLSSSSRGRAAANPFHTGLEFQTRRQRQEIGRVGACDRRGHRVGPKAGGRPGRCRADADAAASAEAGGTATPPAAIPTKPRCPKARKPRTANGRQVSRWRSHHSRRVSPARPGPPEPDVFIDPGPISLQPTNISWQHKVKPSCSRTFIPCSNSAISPGATPMPLASRY